MSVDISDCCHCGTGYGMLVEIDSGKMAHARGERAYRPCRGQARWRDRVLAILRRVGGGRAPGNRGAA